MDSYCSDKLLSFVNELIRNNFYENADGYQLNFERLSDSVKEAFAAQMLQSDDCDLFSITENLQRDEIVSHLLKMLNLDNLDNRLDFADCVKNNIVKYYEKRMKTLIESRIGIVEQEDYEFSGYQKKVYQDNGEPYWVRS